MRKITSLLSAAFIALAVLSTAGAAPVQAATCYGDYCSGKDPQASGCAADAVTVASARIPGTSQNVELRWSPACKTNWARTTWHGSDYNSLKAIQCATGYTQSGAVGDSGGYLYTRMIYSPSKTVKAVWWGAPGNASTACG